MYDEDLFEGDINLTPEQQEELSIGRGSLTTALWPGGIVPYSIDDSISKYMAIYMSVDSSIHRGNPTVVRHRCSQRCDSSGSDSAEITMYTLVWQRWQLTVLWQRCQLPLLSQWCTHRCHTNVNIAVIALSVNTAVTALPVPPLSQRCQLSPLSH